MNSFTTKFHRGEHFIFHKKLRGKRPLDGRAISLNFVTLRLLNVDFVLTFIHDIQQRLIQAIKAVDFSTQIFPSFNYSTGLTCSSHVVKILKIDYFYDSDPSYNFYYLK